MQNIDALTQALRQGAQNKANLAGLDERYGRAETLSNTSNATVDKHGQVSPLRIIGDMIGQSQGRRQMRELSPQREEARQGMADNAYALPLYKAQRDEQAATQAQTNYENTAEAKIVAANSLARAKAAQDKLKRDREDQKAPLVTKVSPDGRERTVRYNAQTGTATLDGQVIPNFSEWTDPVKKNQEVTRGSYGGKAFDKKSAEYLDAINRVDTVYGHMTNVTPEQEQMMNSPVHRAKMAAISTLSPQEFLGLAENQFSGYDEATQAMLIALNSMSAEERNRLFGAALTETEYKNSQTFLAATVGRGLPWMRNALETTKKNNVNSLLRVDGAYGGDTYRNMLTSTGTMPEGYTPEAFELGNAPAVGSSVPSVNAFDDDAEEAAYQAWKKTQGGN